MDENLTPNQPLERASLSSHIFQLATAALVYMGAAKLPGDEEVEVNLPLAKLTIDTLDMLKTKTDGNRTADETSLLDDVLYQLRMSYVKSETAEPSATATPPADKPAS
ncbi:DUF1844 domain-containing protein [candidate division WOR-3 bacterium]|uniref:DUF1844 domain-containing protein n=1 Tax=candidate division WOR-3 bacterium TaxID=2052148 RepID=A0A937XIC2_UNCW3|nr:DUF1844 domain-containing protein [candidate division WOR-3 bacterium]